MPIVHVIAHRIAKQSDDSAIITLRDTELTTTTQQTTLFESLKSSFNTRISRKHGSFDESVSSAILATEITNFQNKKTDFQSLTAKFTNAFGEKLEQDNGDVNAHFIFSLERTDKQTLFYLFIVNQNEYLTFNNTLDITPSYSIDTGSSFSGLKLNIDDWQQRPKYHYLTLVPPKGNDTLSDALHSLTGFGNKIDRAKSTKYFLAKIDDFSQHIVQEKQTEFKTKVIEYCEAQEAKDEAVHIPTLSQSIEGIDCEKFIREMLPHNPTHEASDIDDTLMIDKRSLRQYVKFYGRDKDLSLTFSSKQLDENIFFDEKNETLILKSLPKSLKKQLLAHYKRLADKE